MSEEQIYLIFQEKQAQNNTFLKQIPRFLNNY